MSILVAAAASLASLACMWMPWSCWLVFLMVWLFQSAWAPRGMPRVPAARKHAVRRRVGRAEVAAGVVVMAGREGLAPAMMSSMHRDQDAVVEHERHGHSDKRTASKEA